MMNERIAIVGAGLIGLGYCFCPRRLCRDDL